MRNTTFTDAYDCDWRIFFSVKDDLSIKIEGVRYLGNGNVHAEGYYIPKKSLTDDFLAEIVRFCNLVALKK